MLNNHRRLKRLHLATRRTSESGQALVEYVVLAVVFGVIALLIAQQFITADAVTNYFNNTSEIFSNMVEQVYNPNPNPSATPFPTPPWAGGGL
jgi:hypothetical protein